MRLILSLFLVTTWVGWTLAVSQQFVNRVADTLDVHFNALSNIGEATTEILLRNNGLDPITRGNWSIYFSSIRFASTEGNSQMVIRHVNGYLHKISPSPNFKSVYHGNQISITSRPRSAMVSKTDVMPNWFIMVDGCVAKTIKSTSGGDMSFVGDFVSKDTRKWWFSPDTIHPYTLHHRYVINEESADRIPTKPHVVPSPKEFTVDNKSTVLRLSDYEWDIECGDDLLLEKAYLIDHFKEIGVRKNNASPHKIFLRVDSLQGEPESYNLVVRAENKFIEIVGASSSGVFYGIQSLLSLLSADGSLKNTRIKDAPRYTYRGMQLDVARNFRTPGEVKLLLEAMSMYKLNKLHLHLTDDEGWRLEIDGLPELTQIGGQRCFDMSETRCILTQLGSGPDTTTSGSGFYSAAEYKDILQFAAERHIEVIPEIDCPGHARAAVKAMEARYRNLSSKGETDLATMYLLSDLKDKSVYESISGYNDNAINPCLNSTYTFFRHVIREIVKLHEDVTPLKTFHFGGDEVPPGAWLISPACSHFKGRQHLKKHFVRQVAKIVHEAGLNLAGWEDGFMEGASTVARDFYLNEDVRAYAWNNVWEGSNFARAHILANSGYKTVMSQATHLYFDHPYEPDPDERGLTWATRFISMRKVFGFRPDDLYANADTNSNGRPITKHYLCGSLETRCVALKKPENIIGMEGHLWSETVRTSENMHYMLFPRLLALAERAWHKANWEVEETHNSEELLRKDWNLFVNTIGYKELKRLDRMGIKYRIPPPGATLVNGRLLANVEFPGLDVEYSLDQKETWQDVENGQTIVNKSAEVYYRTKSADGKRYSRAVSSRSSIEATSFMESGLFSVLNYNVTRWFLFLTISIMAIFVLLRLSLIRKIYCVLIRFVWDLGKRG